MTQSSQAPSLKSLNAGAADRKDLERAAEVFRKSLLAGLIGTFRISPLQAAEFLSEVDRWTLVRLALEFQLKLSPQSSDSPTALPPQKPAMPDGN
ncbi:MAG: hypothetical protein AB7F66_17650 [Bacteriovoracia bacterium]